YGGLYCAVDILRREGGGWAIYEVKSSVSHGGDAPKAVYAADISYQKYVLERCGVFVTGTYLVTLNGDYVRDGALDLRGLFRVSDVSDAVALETPNVEANLAAAEKLLASDAEPDVCLGGQCRDPYDCAFWGYCTRGVQEESVFDLYRLGFPKKLEYFRKGWVSYGDLLQNAPKLTAMQRRQLEYGTKDLGTYVDREGVREFLGTLSYPLYFLDFESMQPAVPQFDGTRPYDQIPFQYSLHFIEREGGELMHREFLAESGEDPRRAIAERLCEDIPADVCVTAYNQAFECSRLKALAEEFPDLAEHLLSVAEHVVDLLVPFRNGWYYNRAMGGSFSIKSVLPAIFPDDPELDYHNLEGVHNGGEAMTVFPRIKDMPPEEQAKARRDLLKYCELDTYAMVKVWQELVRVSKAY
ncbi:MAG: DUF2779 domain-containing protein, partial [Oscillospiraceae bacterium]|nr:DUF2779 domain-containing protein [Oscillospiraceae bacterium]